MCVVECDVIGSVCYDECYVSVFDGVVYCYMIDCVCVSVVCIIVVVWCVCVVPTHL